MKKNLIIVVLGIAVIVLFILLLLPSQNDHEPLSEGADQMVIQFYEAVNDRNPEIYTSMFYGWDLLDEERQARIISRYERLAEDFEAQGGLADLQFSRVNFIFEFAFSNDQTREHSQPLLFENGEWKIRP